MKRKIEDFLITAGTIVIILWIADAVFIALTGTY
jgi:hypothetical protein